MEIHRNEIKTGLLVVMTFGLLLIVTLIFGLPGVLQPLNSFRIYFDNADGIRPGAPVYLAGREVGTVKSMHSPVPMDERPAGYPDDEVSIDVEVHRSALVFRHVTVLLTQQGLMGQEIIDFRHDDENSGLALNHAEFVGTRIPDISEAVSDNMQRLTGDGSDLARTIKNLRIFTAKMDEVDIGHVVDNLNKLTGQGSDLADTIKNLHQFTDKLNATNVSQVITNVQQMTDTLKRQPWRLIWPTTKLYPSEERPAEQDLKSDHGR